MTPPDDDDAGELPDDEGNARAFEMLSAELQRQVFDILNGKVPGAPAPVDGWAAIPQVVGHASGTVFGNVLRAGLLKGAISAPVARHMVESVRAIVERAILEAVPEPPEGARWH